VIGALMPFSFFIIQAVQLAWQRAKSDSFIVFCMIATAVVVVFFAFSKTVLPSYPEPALPFLCILLGNYFAAGGVASVFDRWSAVFYCVIAVALPIAASYAMHQDPFLNNIPELPWYFIIQTIGALVGLWWIIRGRRMIAVYSYAIGSFLFLQVFFYLISPQIDEQNPVTQSLPFLKKQNLPIVAYRNFNPAFVFAIGKTLPMMKSPEELATFIQVHDSCYIITQKQFLPELHDSGAQKIIECRDLFEKPVTVVLVK
jgi:4-amino-4-deoxy-L-arabinose transferase-like glycosyltransferase